MSGKSRACLFGFLVVSSAMNCLAQSSERSRTYRETLAARPRPDLTTLVQRSSPKTEDKVSSEAFLDLLKIREIPDSKAVPLLERILIENPNGRIHHYAAAQALFAIGTPQAHQILAQRVLTKVDSISYAGWAIDYTVHWEMQEPLRSRYIDQYLLQNLSKDLAVEVEQSLSGPQPKGRLSFVITFRNISKNAFHIFDDKYAYGEMLHLRDATGQYLARADTGITINRDQPAIAELKPGQPHLCG